MLHRVRARMRFTAQSGLATWARDQMAVRYLQSVTIREGDPAQEAPINEVTGEGTLFICDLILTDEAAATDAFNTLTAPAVWDQVLQIIDEEGEVTLSNVAHHVCDHNEDEREGCEILASKVGP